MINNRGGRKRELSIYSILTIIVLISISGGRETRGETKVINPYDDAALLVTEDFLNEGDRWIEERYIGGQDNTHTSHITDGVTTKYTHTIQGTKIKVIIVDGQKGPNIFSADQGLRYTKFEGRRYKDGWRSSQGTTR